MSDNKATPPNPFELWREWTIRASEANPFFKLFPLNYEEMWKALAVVGTDLALNPAKAYDAWLELAQKQYAILTQTTQQTMGVKAESPVISGDPRDRRFKDEAWDQQPLFNAIKQSYLLTAGWLLGQAAGVEWLGPDGQRRTQFYLRQFVDSLSPSNFLLTNPVVLKETVESRGDNLVRGMQNLLTDLQAGHIRMVDDRNFEFGKNVAATPGQVVRRTPLMELIQYTPTTEQVHARPVLIFPPWINKYYILDLQPKNSLVKYLTDQGFTTFVVSWKNPDASMANTSMEDYLLHGLFPAMESALSITGSPDLNAVGYCIGGTLLAIALAAMKSKGDQRVNAATFFVALQDFEEPGDLGIFLDEQQVSQIEARMANRGYLDSRDMSSVFNLLRANDLIWNYVVNNYLLGKEPLAFDLLFWNADGTRMPQAMHSFYLRNMYLENNLARPNCLTMLGEALDLRRIDQDVYAVGTLEDHIVPWRSAFRIRRHFGGDVRFVLANSGHIAGVINPPGGKGTYYLNESRESDPDRWLESATLHKGSWWSDWVAWLRPRSGEMVPAPLVGNADFPPIEAAPGRYIRE